MGIILVILFFLPHHCNGVDPQPEQIHISATGMEGCRLFLEKYRCMTREHKQYMYASTHVLFTLFLSSRFVFNLYGKRYHTLRHTVNISNVPNSKITYL